MDKTTRDSIKRAYKQALINVRTELPLGNTDKELLLKVCGKLTNIANNGQWVHVTYDGHKVVISNVEH